MKNFILLILREFDRFFSGRLFASTFLLMPVVLGIVLGAVYQQGRVKKQPIIIADLDNTPTSNRLADMLGDNPYLNVVETCHEDIGLQRAMLEKRVISIVRIPDRFESEILSGGHPEINNYVNMSNTLTANSVSSAVAATAATMNIGIRINSLQRKGAPARIAAQNYEAIKLNLFQQYNTSGSYLIYLWSGLVAAILHQLLLLALAVSFAGEVTENKFNSAGLLSLSSSALILITSKVFPYLILSLSVVACYVCLGYIFRIPAPKCWNALFATTFLMVLATSGLAILYSIINPLPIKATQLLMTLASPAFSLSGFSWPSSHMPVFLRGLADIIPLTPFLRAMRMLTVQGANIYELIPHLQHQIIQIIAFFPLAAILLRLKIKKQLKLETIARAE